MSSRAHVSPKRGSRAWKFQPHHLRTLHTHMKWIMQKKKKKKRKKKKENNNFSKKIARELFLWHLDPQYKLWNDFLFKKWPSCISRMLYPCYRFPNFIKFRSYTENTCGLFFKQYHRLTLTGTYLNFWTNFFLLRISVLHLGIFSDLMFPESYMYIH